MKHYFIIRHLLVCFLFSIGSHVFAWDVSIDGIYYNLSENTATVTYKTLSYRYDYNGDVIIPASFTHNSKEYIVTEIGEGAFSNCRGLTSVSIPESITYIASNAFANSSWYDNQPNGLVYAGLIAYKYKGKMPDNTTISIKDGTIGIGEGAFSGCSNLASITLPNSITTIGSSAFQGCGNLTSINIPESLTHIGIGAFAGTPWFNNQADGLVYVGKIAYQYKGTMLEETAITIKDGTKRIGDYAFYRCNNLASITLPNSITSIGISAFSECTGLSSIVIPDGVTDIQEKTFYGCTGLTSITIPESVKAIGVNAFRNCRNLTSISIPENVSKIGALAFGGCESLDSLITIPKSIKAIGFEAFDKCTGAIRILAEAAPSVEGNALLGWSGQYISVPKGSMKSYSSTAPWNQYKEKLIEGPATIEILETTKDYLSINCRLKFFNALGESSLYGEYGVICNGQKYPTSDSYGIITIENLLPETTYKLIPYYIYDGVEYNGQVKNVKTKAPSFTISFQDPSQSKCNGTMTCDNNDIVLDEYGILLTGWLSGDQAELKNQRKMVKCNDGTLSATELIANITYKATPYFVYQGDTIYSSISTSSFQTKGIAAGCVIIDETKTTATGRLDLTLGDANEDDYIFDIEYKENNSTCKAEVIGHNFYLNGLMPDKKYNLTLTVRYRDGSNVLPIYTNNYTWIETRGCKLSTMITPSITTATITNSYDSEELEIEWEGFSIDDLQGSGNPSELTGLEPNHTYSYTFAVLFTNGYQLSKTTSFTTDPILFKVLQPKVVSPGNVVISAESNITNDEELVGFEWRRTDWTDDFESNRGGAVLYEGKMEGYIRNLNTDKLWKFRPYYESTSGQRYYGDWLGLDPTNTSYFDPTVHTYAKIQVQGNSAEIKGYAMRGSDNVTSQGFKYWKAQGNKVLSDNVPKDALTKEAYGNVMTASLIDLDYETEYFYVAFITTSEGETFYGETKSFCTGENLTGIKEIVNLLDDTGRIEAIYDGTGRKLSKMQRGVNVLRMKDGTTRKVFR